MNQNKKTFNPEEIVDFNIDYYSLLGLEKGSLPEGKTFAEKKEIDKILQKAYRKNARHAHPDFGGTAEAFKLIVRAHTILSDPLLRKYYESNGEYQPILAGDGNIDSTSIDWKSLGSYRKGTEADTLGYSLFFQVCERKEELGLIPAFKPIDEYDSYEWDWVLAGEEEDKKKLAISLVHDENDVLRLTSGDAINESLPFKIYICIPRAALYFLRGEEEEYIYKDGSKETMNGRLQAATYSDYNLFETTNLEDARKYINDKLINDLNNFRSGKLVIEQRKRDIESGQHQWVNTNKMKEIDRDVLKAILRMKTIVTVPDKHAADFLEELPTKKKKKKKKKITE